MRSTARAAGRRRYWALAVSAGLVLGAVPAAASASAADQLPDQKQRKAAAVVKSDGLPKIGKIRVDKRDGRWVVSVPVRYTDAVEQPSVKEVVTVGMQVYRKRAKSGVLSGKVQQSKAKLTLRGDRKVTHTFRLKPASVKALKLASGKPRKRQLLVSVSHAVKNALHEQSKDRKATHKKVAKRSWGGKVPGASKRVANRSVFNSGTTATVTLVNNTGMPLHVYEQDIQCMYDSNQEGSDPAGWNAQQGATIAPGATITETVVSEGGSSVSSYQGATSKQLTSYLNGIIPTIENEVQNYLSQQLISKLPWPLSSLAGGLDSCGNNLGAFQLMVADASGKVGANNAWVLANETAKTCDGEAIWSSCSESFAGPLTDITSASAQEDLNTWQWVNMGSTPPRYSESPPFWANSTWQTFNAYLGQSSPVTHNVWGPVQSSWVGDYGLSFRTQGQGNGNYTITVNSGGVSNVYAGHDSDNSLCHAFYSGNYCY